VLSVKHDIIPATINTKNIDDAVSKSVTVLIGESIATKVLYAMNNTFGFGGHTATSIFKKFEG
jgi:3-oxoacyl-[acyl-carrier-protein] synthase II